MSKNDPDHLRLLEAVLFASSEPVAERALARRLPEGANVKAVLRSLEKFYEGRGVVLVHRGGSWAFRTADDLGPRLNLEVEVSRRLSRAAIETLAIIAYHQPATRGEIEEIRGVSLSKGTLDVLFAEGWIKPRGHRDTPGRPLQWGTTDAFLDHFSLGSLNELPGVKDLRAMGLLDARPALEAYSVRGEMRASEDVQGAMEFSETKLVSPAARESQKADDTTRATTDTLDAAMNQVAEAVKKAVHVLEKDDENAAGGEPDAADP